MSIGSVSSTDSRHTCLTQNVKNIWTSETFWIIKIFFNLSQIRVETPYIPTFKIGGLDWWIALRWNHPFPVLCPRRVLPSPMESANKAPGTDSVCHNTNRHALSPKLYMKNGQPRGAKLIQIHESEVTKGVRNHWIIYNRYMTNK